MIKSIKKQITSYPIRVLDESATSSQTKMITTNTNVVIKVTVKNFKISI